MYILKLTKAIYFYRCYNGGLCMIHHANELNVNVMGCPGKTILYCLAFTYVKNVKRNPLVAKSMFSVL